MTPELLAKFIMEMDPRTLLQKDDAGKLALHFLKYRRCKDRIENSARTDDAIAALVVGAAKAEPSLAQLLLQQSAEHAYVAASKRLIEECEGKIDEPSEFEPRTPREIAKAHGADERALFDNSEQKQQQALEAQRHELAEQYELAVKQQSMLAEEQRTELLELFEQKDRDKKLALSRRRQTIFRQTVLFGEPVVEPWGLKKGDFQTWLRQKAGAKNKGALKTLLDQMGDIDGLTVLLDWVDVGFDGKKANCGKLVKERIIRDLGDKKFKAVAFQELSNLLGYLALDKNPSEQILNPGGLSFYKGLLQSCEKRSLLTDYTSLKMLGQGAFGRAHLCKYVARKYSVAFVCHVRHGVTRRSFVQESSQRRVARDQVHDARQRRRAFGRLQAGGSRD